MELYVSWQNLQELWMLSFSYTAMSLSSMSMFLHLSWVVTSSHSHYITVTDFMRRCLTPGNVVWLLVKLRDLNRNALIWYISVLLKFFWECCSTLAPGSLHNSGRRWGINQTWATNTCSSFSVLNRSFSSHIRYIICHFLLLSSQAQYFFGKFSFFSPLNFRREFWLANNCSSMVLGIT